MKAFRSFLTWPAVTVALVAAAVAWVPHWVREDSCRGSQVPATRTCTCAGMVDAHAAKKRQRDASGSETPALSTWGLEVAEGEGHKALIQRRSKLTVDEWLTDFYALGRPVIITDATDGWPIFSTLTDTWMLEKFDKPEISKKLELGRIPDSEKGGLKRDDGSSGESMTVGRHYSDARRHREQRLEGLRNERRHNSKDKENQVKQEKQSHGSSQLRWSDEFDFEGTCSCKVFPSLSKIKKPRTGHARMQHMSRRVYH